MPYFNEFPLIRYEFPDGVVRQIKNLSIRPAVVNEFFGNRSNFEAYTIVDGETPETIAFDQFGDPQYHWAIMLPNNILNIYEDWPKTTNQLQDFLIAKYRDSENEPEATTLEYIEFKGNAGNDYTLRVGARDARPKHFVDANDVIFPFESVEQSYSDAWGRTYQLPDIEPVSIFEYENELNENKRVIVIPKFAVAQRMKAQLRDLVNV